MVIRKANDTDIQNIAELYILNWKTTYIGLLSEQYLNNIDICYGVKKWSDFLKKENHNIFVAYDEQNHFLGFLAYKPDNEIKQCLYVDSLHVLQKSRGKGVGTKLLQYIFQYAIDRKYNNISICIVKGNDNARKLYTKLGAVHYKDFIDDFDGTKSNSEKLIWYDLNCF